MLQNPSVVVERIKGLGRSNEPYVTKSYENKISVPMEAFSFLFLFIDRDIVKLYFKIRPWNFQSASRIAIV